MGYAGIFFVSKLSQATGKVNMDKNNNSKELLQPTMARSLHLQTAKNADVYTYLEEV